MVETGTFIDGIINADGVACCSFTLSERTFRNALELGNDPDLKKELLSTPAYYDAAIISKRLKVTGIDKLTPEQVLDLGGDDSDILTSSLIALDQRRAEFRKAQQVAAQTAAGPA